MTIAVGADIVVELNGVLTDTRNSLLSSGKRASRLCDRQLMVPALDKQPDVEGRPADGLHCPQSETAGRLTADGDT